MLLCADSPIIDNPPQRNPPTIQIHSSLPKSLDQSRLTWRTYGGYAIDYMEGVNPKWKLPSDQFQVDAAAGRLPSVSWVYAPLEFDEHPPYSNPQGASMGNVTKGMQWTVDQVNAIVRGGLWSDVAVFITWDDWGGWYDTSSLRPRKSGTATLTRATRAANFDSVHGSDASSWVRTPETETSRRSFTLT